MDESITVERVRHSLVVGSVERDGAAVLLAANLPDRRDRTFVVVGASSVGAMSRLDPWVVADLADEVRGDLCVVAPGFGAMGPDGALPPARLLADRLGVEVTAADGEPVGLADGTVFVPGRTAGWVSYRPGGQRVRVGARLPAPWWQDGLPGSSDHITHVPAGLWLREPGAADRPADPLLHRAPDPDRMYVVVGAPGEEPPSAQAVAEVLTSLPDEGRDRAVLAWYGSASQAQRVADALAAPIRAAHGVPTEKDLVYVDASGAARWRPFATESVYRPGEPPALDRWTVPLRLPMVGPASYRLTEGWRVDVVPRGLVVRPDHMAVTGAVDTGEHPEIVVATHGPLPVAFTDLLRDLPPDITRSLHILPFDQRAERALKAIDTTARVIPVADQQRPAKPAPPMDARTPPPAGSLVVTADGRLLPAEPILAATHHTEIDIQDGVLTIDLGEPDPSTSLPTVAASTTAPSVRAITHADATETIKFRPLPAGTRRAPSPAAAVQVAAPPHAPAAPQVAALRPGPGLPNLGTHPHPVTQSPAFAAGDSRPAAHSPVPVAGNARPPVQSPVSGVGNAHPAVHPPVLGAGDAHPAVQSPVPGVGQPYLAAQPPFPAAPRPYPAAQSPVANPGHPQPAGQRPVPAPGAPPQFTARLPVPAASAPPQPPVQRSAPELDSPWESQAATTRMRYPAPQPPTSDEGSNAGTPEPSIAAALDSPVTSVPALSTATAVPPVGRRPEAASLPIRQATPVEVPEDARSTPEQRRAMRGKLGARYDVATRAVTQLLSERPGLRFGAGDRAALLTELAVVRVFADEPDGDYDADFHICLADGLRRLPTARAVVLRGIPDDTELRPGELLRLPAPVVAAPLSAAGVGPAEALIWATTARRLDGLRDGGAEFVLPGHTRLRVLALETDPVRRVLLAEDGVGAEAALKRLRAAVAARAVPVDVPAGGRWFGPLPAA